MTDLIRDVRDRNFSLFPVTPNAKTPLVQWRTHEASDTDWTEGRNYGIDCGRSGLVVVDLDTKNGIDGEENFRDFCAKLGQRVPETFKVHTPSGGVHLYFTGKGIRNSASMLAKNVDIRGDGGYVVGPGSEIDGKKYQVADDTDVAELPSWLAKAIQEESIASAVLSSGEWADPFCGQDDQLSRKVFTWRLKGLTKEECRKRWWEVAQELPVERPGAPWTEQDFERHFKGADRKISAKEASEPSEHSGSLRFVSATEVDEKPVEWVWKDRMPRGTLTLCAGPGGSAKSLHNIWLAAEITNGTLDGCFDGEPKNVVWASLEASWEVELVPRLVAAGADLSRISFVRVEPNGSRENDHIKIMEPEHIEDLRSRVQEDNVGLIVLDPLMDVLNNKIDSSKQSDVRESIGRINAFAESEKILISGIAHFNKMTTVDDALSRITGSAAFSQRLRAALVYAYNDEEQRYIITQGKNNWGPMTLPSLSFAVQEAVTPKGTSTIRLNWSGLSEYSVNDILGKRHKPKEHKQTKQERCDDWLDGLLRGNPMPRAQVYIDGELAGFTDSNINRAKKTVGVGVTKQEKTGREGHPGVIWTHPEDD